MIQKIVARLIGWTWLPFATAALACPICTEELAPTDPRVNGLVSRIESEGPAVIPELRRLAADPTEGPVIRTVAVRHLGIFGDRDSIPALRAIVLEIVNPESKESFGPGGRGSGMRAAAAGALGAMGEPGPAEALWSGWAGLELARQLEIPRLLSELRDPQAQERQIAMLRETGDFDLVIQLLIELRRTGTSAALPAAEEWVGKFRRAAAAEEDLFIRKDLNKMVRYAEGTVRALRRR